MFIHNMCDYSNNHRDGGMGCVCVFLFGGASYEQELPGVGEVTRLCHPNRDTGIEYELQIKGK